MVKGWVTLLSSEISFLIHKFKGAGDRGVRRLAAAGHSPPTGNKIGKCVQAYIRCTCRTSFKYF